MAFRSLEQFLTPAIFVLEAQSYIFVPFHNQLLEKSKVIKLNCWRKNTKEQR